MRKRHRGLRLGVINLDSKGLPDTVDLPDPLSAPAPAGLLPCWFSHRDFWPVPPMYAVAKGAFGSEIFDMTPAALAGISAAVDRLAPHCDLIVGNCGYMYPARSVIRSDTPILLSGLQLLPNALESTRRPIGILTFNKPATEKMLSTHPDHSRFRIVGVDNTPAWAAMYDLDFVLNPKVTVDQLRSDLVEVCVQERQAGSLGDIGCLVLECTGMPYFKPDLDAALKLPIWDIATIARGLIGA